MLNSALLLAFPACMIIAASSDLVSMTISNKIPLALCVGFAAAAVLAGLPLAAIGLHLAVGFGTLLATFTFFARGWMGGGDAKLMAATALWFGADADLVSYFIVSSIYGGILTLGLLSVRQFLAPVIGVDFVDRLLDQKTGIPYGIALGVAGLTVFADSAWMKLAVAG